MMLLPFAFGSAGGRRQRRRLVQVADERVDAAADIGRRAALLVALGIVADQADRQVARRLEAQLAAHEIAVAIVDVGVVGRIIVEAVALDVDAVDTRRERVAERHVERALRSAARRNWHRSPRPCRGCRRTSAAW